METVCQSQQKEETADLSSRIRDVCGKSHNRAEGVLPPQVCPYCMGCPIGTIVAGVSGGDPMRHAISIPTKHEEAITDWLDKLEAKLSIR